MRTSYLFFVHFINGEQKTSPKVHVLALCAHNIFMSAILLLIQIDVI